MRIWTVIGVGAAALAIASAAAAKQRTKTETIDINNLPPPVMTIAIPPPAPPPPSAYIQPATLRSGSISELDYPPAAMRMEEQGTVTVRYIVGIDGRVSDCTPINVPALPRLDQETCRLIVRRFRFNPALDEAGAPIASLRSQNVNWVLPPPDPQFLPGAMTISFIVGADGAVSDCAGSGVSPTEGEAANVCAKMKRAEPILDKDGNPIAHRVTYRVVTRSVPIK